MKEITIIQRYQTNRGEDLLTFSVKGNNSVNFMHYHINEIVDVFIDGYIVDIDLLNCRQLVKDNHSILINEITAIINSEKYDQIERINGHYNIIICDKNKNEIIVITDRYGMRPLFWFQNTELAIISNSFSAICSHKKVDDQINQDAIADFLKFEWVTNDATFFRKINRISSGTINIFSEEGLKVKKYFLWPEEIPRNNQSVEKNAEQGYDLLFNAVRRVLTGLSSPGVTLSGGLDTRIITGLINRIGIRPLLYHCLLSNNERLGAQGVADIYDMHLDTEEPLKLKYKINELPIIYGDGCTSINQFWLNRLYRRIHNDNASDCVIDGFNLDLLLNLYGFAIYSYKSSTFMEHGILADEDKTNIADIIYGLPKGYINKYFNGNSITNINEIGLSNISRQCSIISNKDIVHFCRILYLMTRGKRYVYMMPYINQQYCDVRFPGLDYDLIEFCMHLPTFQFRQPLVYLKIFENYFPDLNEVIWAKTGLPLKRGMTRPKKYSGYIKELRYFLKRITLGKVDLETPRNDYNRMFRNDKIFRNSIINILRDGQCIMNGVIRSNGLEKLYDDICYGRNNFFILERLITVELFFRTFVLKANNETGI